jgi:hypothetical protein
MTIFCEMGVPMNFLKRSFALVSVAIGMVGLSCGANAADQNPPIPIKAKPIVDVPFFFLVDDRLTYSHIFNATDAGYYSAKPGGGYNGKTDMDVVAFTHFDVWAYGTNFLNIGVYKSGKNDPAAPCTNAGTITDSLGTVNANCAGTTEIYGLIRSTFGFNEIFATHAFSLGPLHNVSLEVGADADAQNTYFASSLQKYYVGLQLAFDLPYKGYVNIAPLWKHETNHNGFTQCGSVFAQAAPLCNQDGYQHFKDTWAVEMNYYMDLGFLPESVQYFAISGRVGFYGPKGPWQGIAGQEPTKMEINSEPIRLTFDAGKAFLGKKNSHELDLWVAYRYWENQYGDDANSAPFVCTVTTAGVKVSTNSCTTSSAVVGATVKF